MNKPTLVVLVNKVDKNISAFLQSIIDAFETGIIILDTRRQRETIPLSIEINCHNSSVIILHATKSKAPKTGLEYFVKHFKDSSSGVILVDLDQRFTLMDIQLVAEAMDNIPNALIIGGRGISHYNNKSSTFILSLLSRLTGARVEDFDSGLRCIPTGFISDLFDNNSKNLDIWIEMYVHAAKYDIQIVEVSLQSKHYAKSPILTSLVLNSSKLIYLFLRFSFLSVVTAGIDYAIFSALFLISNSILLSIVIARIVSGSFQFFMGKKWVFKSRNKLFVELIKYVLLVSILMLISYWFIKFMVTNSEMNPIISKLIAELSLFILSFTIQKKFVFARSTPAKKQSVSYIRV